MMVTSQCPPPAYLPKATFRLRAKPKRSEPLLSEKKRKRFSYGQRKRSEENYIASELQRIFHTISSSFLYDDCRAPAPSLRKFVPQIFFDQQKQKNSMGPSHQRTSIGVWRIPSLDAAITQRRCEIQGLFSNES